MTFENFEEIFQLIKDDMPKENTNSRETGELYKSYGYEYYSPYSTMSSSAFLLLHFFFFNHLSDFFTFHKNIFTWFKLISLN